MKVLKFGGTSVGSIASLLNVKAIVEAIPAPVIVVVSALGGLTDKLIATAGLAKDGDRSYVDEMDAIASRHFDIISAVVGEELRPGVTDRISELLSELKRRYDGVFLLRELSARTLDSIVSFGERMSSVIVSAMIDGASLHDSLNFIKTEKWFAKNIADQKITSESICTEFEGISDRAVVPGFISTDRDTGEITNLGRGGSDYTAALIAAALDAESLEIWTDVDGFMTADPRVISDAVVVPHMTFVESMELCSFGAKVIYPPTIYPVFHKNIPIRILNTFNPQAPGTLITDTPLADDMKVKGISAIKGTAMFSIRGEAVCNLPEINTRTFNALARRGVTVFIVSGPDNSGEFSFAVAETDTAPAKKALETEFAPELSTGGISGILIEENLATIAVVGEGIREDARLGPRIRNSLLRDSIHVVASSNGNSDTTLTFVVPLPSLGRSLKIIHALVV